MFVFTLRNIYRIRLLVLFVADYQHPVPEGILVINGWENKSLLKFCFHFTECIYKLPGFLIASCESNETATNGKIKDNKKLSYKFEI